MSDRELVALTRQGNCDAYGEIVSRYKHTVFCAAYSVIAEHYTAEDIAQETFLDGYLGIGRLREPDYLSSWLYHIAKRKSLHFVTRRRPLDDISAYAEQLPAEDTSPEQAYLQKEKAAAIRRAVSSLSEKNRVVTELYYLENLPVAAIANRLSLPIGTVKSRLHDARDKLKGVLRPMTDQNVTLSPAFESKLREKIKALSHYYATHGESYEGFDSLYTEAETMINTLPDSKEKQAILADLYLIAHYRNKEDEELRQKTRLAAENGENASVLCSLYLNTILNLNNAEAKYREITNTALPHMEKWNATLEIGVLRYWRGVALHRLNRIDEALADFHEAEIHIPPENSYHACAVAAAKALILLQENAEDCCQNNDSGAATIGYRDGRLLLINQPGYSCNSSTHHHHVLDSLDYYLSRFDRCFFDLSMEVGKSYPNKDGSATMTVLSYEDTVTVPAGSFTQCLHLIYNCPAEYRAEVWYAKRVGLVRAAFSGPWVPETEEYLLSDYTVKAGDGYFPLGLGNRWEYAQANVPVYIFRHLEFAVDWTDGETAILSRICIYHYRKNHQDQYALDSEYWLQYADTLCVKDEYDESIEALKRAIRLNTTQKDTLAALSCLDYMTRITACLQKNYRLCPSSVGISHLTIDNGIVRYDQGSFAMGPYRFGTRGEENRIFGAKPFRYLQRIFGRLYDPKWVPGYTEQTVEDGVPATLTVTEGGSVTTPAGTFDNCLKLTITAEKPKETKPDYYFSPDYYYTFCGTKEYWLAPGVGIVRFDCTWGQCLSSSLVLVSCQTPAAAADDYFPIELNNAWEYDEVNLTAEGYRAKRIIKILSGHNDRYLLHDAQEFLYWGTEEEYETFKKSLHP